MLTSLNIKINIEDFVVKVLFGLNHFLEYSSKTGIPLNYLKYLACNIMVLYYKFLSILFINLKE